MIEPDTTTTEETTTRVTFVPTIDAIQAVEIELAYDEDEQERYEVSVRGWRQEGGA